MRESVATVAELWRYPVKGMRGERLHTVEFDAHGVAGDRRFAMQSRGAPRGKPLLTGAERAAMLLYTATGAGTGSATYVTTPAGATFPIYDAGLLASMQGHLPGGHALSLVQSAAPQTDVRPVALLATGTVTRLLRELGRPVDARRFRANLLLNMAEGIEEGALVGKVLHVGCQAELRVLERTPRCRIVTLDPATATPDPALMKHLDRAHGGRVGVYAAVLRPGTVHTGDGVWVA